MIEGRERSLCHAGPTGGLSTESVNNSETVWITRTLNHIQRRVAWDHCRDSPLRPDPGPQRFEVTSR